MSKKKLIRLWRCDCKFLDSIVSRVSNIKETYHWVARRTNPEGIQSRNNKIAPTTHFQHERGEEKKRSRNLLGLNQTDRAKVRAKPPSRKPRDMTRDQILRTRISLRNLFVDLSMRKWRRVRKLFISIDSRRSIYIYGVTRCHFFHIRRAYQIG